MTKAEVYIDLDQTTGEYVVVGVSLPPGVALKTPLTARFAESVLEQFRPNLATSGVAHKVGGEVANEHLRWCYE